MNVFSNVHVHNRNNSLEMHCKFFVCVNPMLKPFGKLLKWVPARSVGSLSSVIFYLHIFSSALAVPISFYILSGNSFSGFYWNWRLILKQMIKIDAIRLCCFFLGGGCGFFLFCFFEIHSSVNPQVTIIQKPDIVIIENLQMMYIYGIYFSGQSSWFRIELLKYHFCSGVAPSLENLLFLEGLSNIHCWLCPCLSFHMFTPNFF